MAVLGFAFLLCMTMSVTIGSESVASNQEKMKQLEDRISSLEASIPQTLQLEIKQVLITVLDEVEVKFKNFARTNNVSEMGEVLRNELQTLLSNHTLRMEDEIRNQTLLINKLSSQLVDVQTRPATSTVPLRFHVEKNSGTVNNVSCLAEENSHEVRFSRLLDIGTGWTLPTDARTFTRDGLAVLDLSRVPDTNKRGVYQCGHFNRTGMTFVIGRFGWFERPTVASVGDNVTLGYAFGTDHPSIRWLHDGQRIPAWDGRRTVDIVGVGKEDAGVYERYEEGERRVSMVFSRLVVRGCPAGFFGQCCDQKCPDCDNGGLCDEKLGTCVCAPGYKGRRCEAACGQNRIGPDCSESCDGGDCISQHFCLPDPHGCFCAPGYREYNCGFRCKEGTFGSQCKMACHCQEGSCDPYTGACSGGCSEGWTGASCQIPVGN